FEQASKFFFSGNDIDGIEFDFICKNGAIKTMLVNGRVARDESGNFERTHCILTDVTARRTAEHLLQESELRLREIVENIQDLFWMTDTETQKIIYINPAFQSVWELDAEKLYENPRLFLDYVHPEDRERVTNSIDNLKKGIYHDMEYRIITPKGKQHLVHDRAFPVHNEKGEVYRVAGIIQDISQLSDITDKLCRTEIQFKTIFNNSAAGMLISTADARISSVNNTFAQMLGYLPAELEGMSIEDISHPDEWNLIQRMFKEVREGKREDFQVEKRYIRKDGSSIWCLLSSNWVSNDEPGSGFYIALILNIDDKKQAEDLLKKELLERNAILNAAPIGIGLVKDRVFEWVSERFLKMLGYTEAEVLQKNSRFIYPSEEEYLRVGREKYAQIDKTGFGEIETRIVRKDGTEINVLLSSSPLDQDYVQAGHIFTALDITHRKKVENELVQKHIELTTLLNSFPSPICIKDRDLNYQIVNKAFLDFTGLSEDQVIGKAEIDLFPCQSETSSFETDWEVLRNREKFIDSNQCLSNAEGDIRYFNTTKTPIVCDDNSVSGLVCISTDITDIKTASEQRLIEEQVLRKALIREVHHRIKNHLQGIVMLISNVSLEDDPQKILNNVINQIRTIAAVYGLQAQEQGEKIYFSKLVSSCISLYDKKISFNTENALINECDDELASEESVPVALIVNELIVNAEKHSSGVEEGQILVSLGCNGCSARLSVSNPCSELPQHFDFSKGTGLGTGLSLLRTLIPKEGASLTYFEKEGVVTVELCLEPPVMVSTNRN
ncbi:MAG: PAS domain S-box protein, partial [Gammaproteobacteria bacterium]|nr:PAS domain S-box protein [Gammaproteobacteria bacterium]